MDKEEIIKVINRVLQIDGVNVKALDVLPTTANEKLVTIISYILGKLDSE